MTNVKGASDEDVSQEGEVTDIVTGDWGEDNGIERADGEGGGGGLGLVEDDDAARQESASLTPASQLDVIFGIDEIRGLSVMC